MTKRLLVAVDGSDESIDAVRFAAGEWPDASLTLLHVINPADSTIGSEAGFAGAVEQWYDDAQERGERFLETAAGAVDRDVESRLEVGRPTATIVQIANGGREADGDGDGNDRPFDHVVLASQGRTGLSRVLLGSVAEGVVRRAEVPVTVVR